MQEEEPILISALAQYGYCTRRCGLMHVEQLYEENPYTLMGIRSHSQVDVEDVVTVRGARIEKALPLWSDRLGLVGKADVVEFWPDGTIYPVEYKHGPRRHNLFDALQVCAQGMCLEEMFGRSVEKGAIYHISSRRRREVIFSEELRTKVLEAIADIRDMIRDGRVPPPVNDKRCPNCSLHDICMPEVLATARFAWHAKALYRLEEMEEEEDES
jgi:CRISPR-associated exonuclease Cas4